MRGDLSSRERGERGWDRPRGNGGEGVALRQEGRRTRGNEKGKKVRVQKSIPRGNREVPADSMKEKGKIYLLFQEGSR